MTETNVRNTEYRIGPFKLAYGYQRADLQVSGPALYPWLRKCPADFAATTYTSSGMAAVSSVLIAINRVFPGAEIVAPAGLYNETIEAIETCCTGLRVANRSSRQLWQRSNGPTVLLIDSSVETKLFDLELMQQEVGYDLLVLDTTCLALNSRRIKRIVCWASSKRLPAVLVRSHTKLDSFGIEYGRLGSAVFVMAAENHRFEELVAATRDSVRLLGVAPVPAHLPPFVGNTSYHHLSQKRIAAIMRNGRSIASILKTRGVPIKRFQHGLYGVLCPWRPCDQVQAKRVAAEIARRLQSARLPARHAGSFGFDFAALDGFPNRDTHGIRLTFPDAPRTEVNRLAEQIAAAWTDLGLRYSE